MQTDWLERSVCKRGEYEFDLRPRKLLRRDGEQVLHPQLLCSTTAICAVDACALLSFAYERKKRIRKGSINQINKTVPPEFPLTLGLPGVPYLTGLSGILVLPVSGILERVPWQPQLMPKRTFLHL